jgi:DNA-directed RNA polymerase specialized sigma24 family protein
MKEPSQHSRTNESLLRQSLKNGSHEAFAEIYGWHHSVIFSYAMKIHHDPQRMMDIIQEVFIDLWKMRENLSDIEDDHIKFYLFKAVTRRMHRHLQLAAVINEKIQAGAAYLFPEPVSQEDHYINKESYDQKTGDTAISRSHKALSPEFKQARW